MRGAWEARRSSRQAWQRPEGRSPQRQAVNVRAVQPLPTNAATSTMPTFNDASRACRLSSQRIFEAAHAR